MADALFPFELDGDDDRTLTIREAPGPIGYTMQIGRTKPFPITDPDDLVKLSLVLELAATRRRNDRDHISEAEPHRARSR